jgi:hypothetical protein
MCCKNETRSNPLALVGDPDYNHTFLIPPVTSAVGYNISDARRLIPRAKTIIYD